MLCSLCATKQEQQTTLGKLQVANFSFSTKFTRFTLHCTVLWMCVHWCHVPELLKLNNNNSLFTFTLHNTRLYLLYSVAFEAKMRKVISLKLCNFAKMHIQKRFFLITKIGSKPEPKKREMRLRKVLNLFSFLTCVA